MQPAACSTIRRPAGRRDQHPERRQLAQRAPAGSGPGVDPFIEHGGLLFLNPAAFATPAPGTYGNLERGSLHGPGFRSSTWCCRSTSPSGGARNVEFRVEIFNVFNRANFANPVATLPNALPTTASTEANKVQPGPGIHVGRRRRHVRHAHEHSWPNGRSWHGASGPVRLQVQLLTERLARLGRARPCSCLRDGRMSLTEAGHLFECVSQLQDAEVLFGAADDLDANRKSFRREACRH